MRAAVRAARAGGLLFEIFSSPVLLAWLVGGWVVYYVMLSIWNAEAFAFFVGRLRSSFFVQLPFVLFLASGFLNLAKTSVRLWRRTGLSGVLFVVLPLGGLIFLSGLFVSIATREFDWLAVAEGHVVQTRWDGASYRVTAIDDGLRDRFLDSDVSGEAGTGFFEYEPRITLQDSSSRSKDIGAFPPARIGSTYFHILNFGLAPGVRLLERGRVKDEGYIPLKILMPGSSDYFEIPNYPYRFVFSIEPERTFQKGRITASEFNVRKPLYKVKVFEGERVIAEEVSKKGISFDGFALEFLQPTTWVQLEAVKDPGVPLVLGGIIIAFGGVPAAVLAALCRLIRRLCRFRSS